MRMFFNAVCYCRWLILWSFVKCWRNVCLIIPLLNCRQDLSFLSHSYQIAGGKKPKNCHGKSFSSWVRLWIFKLLLQFTGSIDSTFNCLFHRWETEVTVKCMLVSHLLFQQGQNSSLFLGLWVVHRTVVLNLERPSCSICPVLRISARSFPKIPVGESYMAECSWGEIQFRAWCLSGTWIAELCKRCLDSAALETENDLLEKAETC